MDWGRQDLSNPSNQNPDVRLFGDKMMEIGNLNDFLKLDECDSSKNTIVSHFTEIKQSIESCQVHISKSASILIEEIEKYEKRAQNSLNESKRLCLKILHEAVFPMSEKKGQYTEMLLNLPHSQIGPYLPT